MRVYFYFLIIRITPHDMLTCPPACLPYADYYMFYCTYLDSILQRNSSYIPLYEVPFYFVDKKYVHKNVQDSIGLCLGPCSHKDQG